jgi:hypothetical protein
MAPYLSIFLFFVSTAEQSVCKVIENVLKDCIKIALKKVEKALQKTLKTLKNNIQFSIIPLQSSN